MLMLMLICTGNVDALDPPPRCLPRCRPHVAQVYLNLGCMLTSDDGSDRALGRHCGAPTDVKRGVRYLEQAAELGELSAAYNLGYECENGDRDGVGKDLQKSVEWHRRAADGGYATSQFVMCLAYSASPGNNKRFRGVLDPDSVEALRWLKLAAAQGHPRAMLWLGNALSIPGHYEGVPVRDPPHAMCGGADPTAAVRLFRAAAERGCSASAKSLANMYVWGCDPEKCNLLQNGFGVYAHLNHALRWYLEAVEIDDTGRSHAASGAMMALAWSLAAGYYMNSGSGNFDASVMSIKGTPDPVGAAAFMERAAEYGHPQALKYKYLSPKDKAAVMASPLPPGLYNHPLIC